MNEYKIRNADGSLWSVVMYADLAQSILERGKTDTWLLNTGKLPQTIEIVPFGVPDECPECGLRNPMHYDNCTLIHSRNN